MKLKEKIQQFIKNIKTIFYKKGVSGQFKKTSQLDNDNSENKRNIGRLIKYIYITLIKHFMGEDKTTTDADKIRFENDMLFNKNTTLISTGALVLTVGFIEKLIPISTANYISILYISWGLFILSLIINLISFLIGSDFGFKISKDENSISTETYNNRIISFNRKISIANWTVFSTLIIGIITTCVFIFINFNNKTMENKNLQKTEIQFLNEGIKYSLKKTDSPKVIIIEKPLNTSATLTQTNDTITIKIDSIKK